MDSTSFPEWTELTIKGGLDPLGMQNSCVRLYQRLIPGISNVTNRLRYYGFYAWLADSYAKNVGIPDAQRWKQFLRRAEALYAAIAVRADESQGVAGSNYLRELLNELEDHEVLDLSKIADQGDGERQYLKQSYGAFGAAYGGPLHEVSVLAVNPETGVPNPSAELGDTLAQLFKTSTGGNAAHRFLEAVDSGQIRVGDLDSLVEFSPERISEFGEECDFYRQILFATQEFKPEDRSRKVTLQLLLKATSHLGRQPEGADEVRWLLFNNDDYGEALLNLNPTELEQAHFWSIYHAADLLHDCYEAFLRLFLDTLSTNGGGMNAAEAISETVSKILNGVENPARISIDEFDERNMAGISDNELVDRILTTQVKVGHTPREDAGLSALCLLVRLYRRFMPEIELIDELFEQDGANAQTLSSELKFIDSRSSLPLWNLISELIESKVLNRHLWVAMRKLSSQKDYTFLIESDDGLLRCRRLDGPAPTNPRLGPAIDFLRDAHLIRENGITQAAGQYIEASL